MSEMWRTEFTSHKWPASMHTTLTGNPQYNRFKCTSENFSYSQLFWVAKLQLWMKDNERQETISNTFLNNVMKRLKLRKITDLNKNQMRVHDNLLWNALKACNSQEMKAKNQFWECCWGKPVALEHLLTEQRYCLFTINSEIVVWKEQIIKHATVTKQRFFIAIACTRYTFRWRKSFKPREGGIEARLRHTIRQGKILYLYLLKKLGCWKSTSQLDLPINASLVTLRPVTKGNHRIYWRLQAELKISTGTKLIGDKLPCQLSKANKHRKLALK